jgi:hypothetical protein
VTSKGQINGLGETPPTGDVKRIVTTWEKQIHLVKDPLKGGQVYPALAGHMYLFGSEISYPLKGDGKVLVSLYDDRPLAMGGQPVALEGWCYDKDTLNRLMTRDFFGWNYTLILPLSSYRPDLQCVHLEVRYLPEKGSQPLFSPGSTMTLQSPETVNVQVTSRTVIPGQTPTNGPMLSSQSPARPALPGQGPMAVAVSASAPLDLRIPNSSPQMGNPQVSPQAPLPAPQSFVLTRKVPGAD